MQMMWIIWLLDGYYETPNLHYVIVVACVGHEKILEFRQDSHIKSDVSRYNFNFT